MFKSDFIESLKNDYSIFQTTPYQYQYLRDLANLLSYKLSFDRVAFMNFITKVIVDWQIEYQMYHYEARHLRDQEKLSTEQLLFERGYSVLKDHLESDEEQVKLKEILDETLSEHRDKLINKIYERFNEMR